MKMKFLFFTTIIFCFAMLIACGDGTPENMPTDAEIQQELLRMNQEKSKEESDSIAHYIQKKGWQMTTLRNGIRFQMIEAGRGDSVRMGETITLAYKVFLLNDKLCYESTPADPVTFKVGEDHIESGIHEVVRNSRKGDRIRIILPSILAFGFTGDNNKIPGDSPLCYELFILNR
jgi:FKBP-type peptidyl-prolyl cis-trans isomerase